MRRRWRKCQRKNNNNAKENGTRKIPFLTRCNGAGGKASARIRRTERVKFRSSRARHSTSRARARGVRESGKYVCSHTNTHTNLHSHTGILGHPRKSTTTSWHRRNGRDTRTRSLLDRRRDHLRNALQRPHARLAFDDSPRVANRRHRAAPVTVYHTGARAIWKRG